MGKQDALKAYLAQQTADLALALDDPANHPVGVQRPEQSARDLTAKATWSWDPEVTGNHAFIRSIASRREYWVHVDYDGYRNAFLAWIGAGWGVARDSVPGVLHADHMLNREFCRPRGIPYVRMALVWESHNTAYGSSFEKSVSGAQGGTKSQYLMDYLILLKVMGIKRSDATDFANHQQEIARKLRERGVTTEAAMLIDGIAGMKRLWDLG